MTTVNSTKYWILMYCIIGSEILNKLTVHYLETRYSQVYLQYSKSTTIIGVSLSEPHISEKFHWNGLIFDRVYGN